MKKPCPKCQHLNDSDFVSFCRNCSFFLDDQAQVGHIQPSSSYDSRFASSSNYNVRSNGVYGSKTSNTYNRTNKYKSSNYKKPAEFNLEYPEQEKPSFDISTVFYIVVVIIILSAGFGIFSYIIPIIIIGAVVRGVFKLTKNK